MTAAFQAGQQVRLTRGDEALNGSVAAINEGNANVIALGVARYVDEWSLRGWTVAVVEPPKLELPTEPGYYVPKSTLPVHVRWIARLSTNGKWSFVGNQGYASVEAALEGGGELEALGSLKDHAEEIAAWISVHPAWPWRSAAEAIRVEFGEASE